MNPGSGAFPKKFRLLRQVEFRLVYEEGQRRSASVCTVFFRPNGRAETRLGVTVSARLGGAVLRNRIKRRVREIFRLNRWMLAEGWDIVVNPRKKAATIAYPVLKEQLLRLFPRQAPSASSRGYPTR
ncbi:MAG: ribonuclease P protein component [Acidobacteria bacterium]|nr:ribonuclease P protein component [Acidobacteriota bacterium]